MDVVIEISDESTAILRHCEESEGNARSCLIPRDASLRTNFVLYANGFITPMFDDGALANTLLKFVSRLANSIFRYFFSS